MSVFFSVYMYELFVMVSFIPANTHHLLLSMLYHRVYISTYHRVYNKTVFDKTLTALYNKTQSLQILIICCSLCFIKDCFITDCFITDSIIRRLCFIIERSQCFIKDCFVIDSIMSRNIYCTIQRRLQQMRICNKTDHYLRAHPYT